MTRKSKYGSEFAEKVYAYLLSHKVIGRNHYGYCGVGFVLEGDKILYTHFDEWLTYQDGKHYVPGEDYLGIIATFDTKEAFVAWLAEQSDDSLSGKEVGDDWYTDNQRVTKRWLALLLDKEGI